VSVHRREALCRLVPLAADPAGAASAAHACQRRALPRHRLNRSVISGARPHPRAPVPHQSMRMLAALATFVYFANSCLKKAAVCSGVLATISAPSEASRFLMPGVDSACSIALLSLSTMSCGVLAGTIAPYQVLIE